MSKKMISTQKTKFFWAYFIVATISILLGVILMPNIWPDSVPFSDWGTKIVSGIIAGALIAYLALFLWKKFKTPQRQAMQIITIIEFALIAVIAIFAILNIFGIGNKLFSASKTFGLALWLRGVVEIFRAYYHEHDDKEKLPLYWVCFSILLVTLGAFLYFSNLIKDVHIIWTFVALLLLAGLFCISMGFVTKPASKKTVENKKEEVKVEDKKEDVKEDKKDTNEKQDTDKKETKKQEKSEEKSVKKENKEVKKEEKKVDKK